MNIEKVKINKYFLDFNKKSIIEFYIFFKKKGKGNFIKTIEELVLVSSLGIKEIDFLIEFSKNINLIKIFEDKFDFKSDLTNNNFFINVGKYYLNNIYSNPIIHEKIFKKSNISLENDFILIDSRTININYTPILTTLSRIGFLNYKGEFAYVENYILAKKLLERPLKKLVKSQKEYEQDLFRKAERGKLAEKFVMNHELNKLKDFNIKPIRKSIYDVGLGYDILSYNLEKKEIYIEVKSIIQNKIYWTNNEILTSKKLGNKYFIYCVLFKDNKPEKIEKIIENPYDEIFIKNNFEKKSTGDFQVFLT